MWRIAHLQAGTVNLHGQNAEVRDIENLQVFSSDVTIIGNDADNQIELAKFNASVVDGEPFHTSPSLESSAVISGGNGNDTVMMNYDRNGSDAGPEALEYDGGEGFDTLSYAITETNLLAQGTISELGLEEFARCS